MCENGQVVTPLAIDEVTPKRRPLRVCHLAYTFYENDNRVMRYAEALREKGHDIDVIALRRPKQPRIGRVRNVRVFRIQRRSVTERRAWVHLAKLTWFLAQSTALLAWLSVRRPYDIVHVHNVPDFLVFAALVPKLMGARVILDIHDALPELYAGKFGGENCSRAFRSMLLVERLSCHFAHHVIVSNDIWREKLIQRALPACRCTTILNYPDVRLFHPLKHGGGDGKFRVLYPGSLNLHQGVDVLLSAFQLLPARLSEAELLIYGEGAALADLMELSEKLGIASRVRFMRPVPIDQIPSVVSLKFVRRIG